MISGAYATFRVDEFGELNLGEILPKRGAMSRRNEKRRLRAEEKPRKVS